MYTHGGKSGKNIINQASVKNESNKIISQIPKIELKNDKPYSIDQLFFKMQSNPDYYNDVLTKMKTNQNISNSQQPVQKISLPMANNMQMEYIYNNTTFDMSKYKKQTLSNVEDFYG